MHCRLKLFYWTGTIEKTKRIYRSQTVDFNRSVNFNPTYGSSLRITGVISNKNEKGD